MNKNRSLQSPIFLYQSHTISNINCCHSTIPVKITAVTTNSEHTKKPLTKLQKRKSPASDDEEWELVPPDGGWVRNHS